MHKINTKNKETPDVAGMVFLAFALLIIIIAALFKKEKKYEQSYGEYLLMLIFGQKKYKLPFHYIKTKFSRYSDTKNELLIEKIYNGEFDKEKYENDNNLDDKIALLFGNYHYDVTKDYTKMFKFYLIAVRKNNTESMIELAKYYDFVLKNNNEKVKYLSRAVIDHNDKNAKIRLGEHYLKMKNYNEMFKYFNMVPNDPKTLQYLGSYYFQINDHDKMIEKYKEAIKLNNHDAMVKLGAYYQNIKKYDEMEKYLLMAIKFNDKNAMHSFGIHYKNLKNYNKTEEYFIMGIKYGDDNSYQSLKKIYNELKIYILLESIENNMFVDEYKNALLLKPKITHYTKNKDEKNICECNICFEITTNIKLNCIHMLCYDCFYKLNKCPFGCNKYI